MFCYVQVRIADDHAPVSVLPWWLLGGKDELPRWYRSREKVENGAISAVRHLEIEDSWIFGWQRQQCGQEHVATSPAVPRCFLDSSLPERKNSGSGIDHGAGWKWSYLSHPSSWEWRFLGFSMTAAAMRASTHRQLFPGASLTALWWKGGTPAVVSTTERVGNGAISAVRHLQNEDSFIFRWRRQQCGQEHVAASPPVPRCFPDSSVAERMNSGGGIDRGAGRTWRYFSRPSFWEWRFVYFSMTAMAMRAGRCRRITSCAFGCFLAVSAPKQVRTDHPRIVSSRLTANPRTPVFSADGPSTHRAFSVHGSSARRDFLADGPLGRGSFFVVVDGTTMVKTHQWRHRCSVRSASDWRHNKNCMMCWSTISSGKYDVSEREPLT